ncbi:MAG: UDP-N-acetylmuramoyl-tripeptide--D-alanyl-D-alanine ligase, partial [Ignavibacteriae bacterium]|nr:UDP-N-acetylmuramoyl-tripeptide--D-alanyl-D-alanine ligase [Ignavibacteriota bacterium]
MFTFDELLSLNHVAAGNLPKKKVAIKNVTIDSRLVKKGDVFVAIKGERFDGHDFLSGVVKSGAACVIINERFPHSKFKFPYIAVNNTLHMFGQLARLHRRKFPIPVIAITGSSGKTTEKEMSHSILKTTYKVLCTQGNLNNHIGVPQTLFRLNEKHEVAIIEMGMNHAGEIQYLCEIAEPTHGLITNIGKAHIEFFRTVDKIAEAKGELFDWLSKDNRRIGFVNLDDVRIQTQARVLKRKVTYS